MVISSITDCLTLFLRLDGSEPNPYRLTGAPDVYSRFVSNGIGFEGGRIRPSHFSLVSIRAISRFSDKGQWSRHFTEDDEVAIADDLDAELIQTGAGQLIFDLGGRERRQQAVVEIPLQDRRFGRGIFSDQGLCPGAAGWPEEIGHEDEGSLFCIAAHTIPKRVRVVEVMKEIVRQDHI